MSTLAAVMSLCSCEWTLLITYVFGPYDRCEVFRDAIFNLKDCIPISFYILSLVLKPIFIPF